MFLSCSFFANDQNRGPIFHWRWLIFVTWIFEPMGWNLHFDLLIDDRAWIVEFISRFCGARLRDTYLHFPYLGGRFPIHFGVESLYPAPLWLIGWNLTISLINKGTHFVFPYSQRVAPWWYLWFNRGILEKWGWKMRNLTHLLSDFHF